MWPADDPSGTMRQNAAIFGPHDLTPYAVS